MPQTLSIYRGYCAQGGLGEWPTDTPGAMRGEQYLAADAELWQDSSLANAARPWMTLYDDQALAYLGYRLGEKIEGWSYFNYGDLRFVVHLVYGGKFTGRLGYFSHGQAWDIHEFKNGFDPGALLGRSEAFHPPWREGQPFQKAAEVAPAMVWRELLKTHEAAAIHLLAQLYRACVTNCPVVVGIPASELISGGRIHQLVSFARAALPLQFKRDCRIRVLTGQPEVYLGELGAHLVVIPEELADKALTARRDAALLDIDCQRRAGPEAETGYARRVVDRVLKLDKFPDALFLFTERLSLPEVRMPNRMELDTLPILYNKAAAAGNQALFDGLLDHLQKQAVQPEVSLDWSVLIRPDEWKQFSHQKLKDLALTLAGSPGLIMLRDGARAELVRKGVKLDEGAQTWVNSIPQQMQPREILDLIKANLVSRVCAAAMLPKVSPKQFDELMDQDETADLVVEVLSHSETAGDLSNLLQREAHVHRLLRIARDTARRSAADVVVQSMVVSGRIPEGLKAADLLAFTVPPPESQLENYLNWAEVLDMAGSKNGSERIKDLLRGLQDRDARRRLFADLSEPRWKVLQKSFVLPESWDADVRDLLLKSPSQLSQIGTRRILRLLDLADEMPEPVTQVLDESMSRQGKETTDALVRAGFWMLWRCVRRETAQAAFSFRGCAMMWLVTASADPQLEEWKQVMLDVGQFSHEDLQQLRWANQGRRPPWPQITLSEDIQLADLSERCGDLGVAADLAEATGLGDSAYSDVLEYFRIAHPVAPVVSVDAFLCLSRGPSSSLPLPLDQAQSLLLLAGHHRPQALDAISISVLHGLSQRPCDDAVAAADAVNLWNEAAFHRRVAAWVPKYLSSVDSPEIRTALGILDSHITSSWQALDKRDPGLDKLAQVYASRQLNRLADFLSPNLYRNLAYALMRGDAEDIAWKKLVELKSVDRLSQHPLMLLAHKIQEMSREQEEQLDRNGWSTFKKACHREQRMSVLFGHSMEGLAVLHLAALLRNDAGLGEVARGVLSLHGISRAFGDEHWWNAFLGSMESCQRRSPMLRITDNLEHAWVVLSSALHRLKPVPYQAVHLLGRRIMARFPVYPSAGDSASGRVWQ